MYPVATVHEIESVTDLSPVTIRKNQTESKSFKGKEKITIEPIHVPYSELYPQLLHNRLVAPQEFTPTQPKDGKFPPWYDANAPSH